MKFFFTILSFGLTLSGFAQLSSRPIADRIIVKTNILSFIAQRPTLTVEKLFTKSSSLEVSFVQGELNSFLLTDHYAYSGMLIRAKKYMSDVDLGKAIPYAALYVGNLKRSFQTSGRVDNSGYFGYSSTDFSANSLRGGGSLGISYIAKNKLVIDGFTSLGYGKYTKIYKPDSNKNSNGYLDAQIWFSLGYCF